MPLDFFEWAASSVLGFYNESNEERSSRLLGHGDYFAVMTSQAGADYLREVLGEVSDSVQEVVVSDPIAETSLFNRVLR